MKSILLFACLIGLVACDKQEMRRDWVKDDIERLGDNLNYYKDSRTNLCFAGMYLNSHGAVFTSVQCTPEVEKLAHTFTSTN